LRDAPDGRVHYYSIIKFVGEKDGQTLRSPDESILLSSSSNGNHRLEIRCGPYGKQSAQQGNLRRRCGKNTFDMFANNVAA